MQEKRKRFEILNFNGNNSVTYADLMSQGKLKLAKGNNGYLKDAAGKRFEDPAATCFSDSPRESVFNGEIKVRVAKK